MRPKTPVIDPSPLSLQCWMSVRAWQREKVKVPANPCPRGIQVANGTIDTIILFLLYYILYI